MLIQPGGRFTSSGWFFAHVQCANRHLFFIMCNAYTIVSATWIERINHKKHTHIPWHNLNLDQNALAVHYCDSCKLCTGWWWSKKKSHISIANNLNIAYYSFQSKNVTPIIRKMCMSEITQFKPVISFVANSKPTIR